MDRQHGQPGHSLQCVNNALHPLLFDPMNDPVETSELLAFVRIVEAKSLARAAAELGAPRATISRRLARLEERLDVRLLRRTTRSLALTDAGESFYRHARLVLDAVHQAEASVRTPEGGLHGTIRASFPPMVDSGLRAVICAFAARHREVRLQLDFSTRHVDLQREGYDLALRATTTLAPGLVIRSLQRSATFVVAAPSYLRAFGTPKLTTDLRQHRCLMGFERGEVPQTHWPLKSGGRVAVSGTMFTNDVNLLVDAAVRGLGLALVPGVLADAPLARGELVQVLDDLVGVENRVALVYPDRELLAPQVRAFLDTIAAWMPNALTAPPREPTKATKPAPKATTSASTTKTKTKTNATTKSGRPTPASAKARRAPSS
jgi:DNA-binding transcriptional LysR family regulator